MKATVLTAMLLYLLCLHVKAQTPRYTVANGEYANFILDNSTQTLYGIGSGGTGIGSNTGQIGYAIPCQFPSANTKIVFAAAGLHTASCIDAAGNVYFTGPNEDGTEGNGTTTGTANSFVQVATDANGQPFNNVKFLRMASSIFTGGAGYGALIYAIKNDGTLWVWGNTEGGYAGDGTYGSTLTRPTQITSFPAGTQITKIVASSIVIALDANGNVWTWAGNGNPDLLGNASQTDYETPHMITLPGKATDIAGGGFFSYALLQNQSLYGWGWYTGYLGVGSAAAAGTPGMAPPTKPILLDTALNLPAKISTLSTNNTTTYVILTDGSLWAWGGNECGQVGTGIEIDYSKYTTNPAPYGGTPTPYEWDQDMSTAQCQVHKPVNIAPGLNNFVGLSEGVCAVWYKFAVDANGQLYSWGRNKSSVLANGIAIGNYTNGTIIADYPNSLDVPYVTAINPFSGGKTVQSTSPLCLTTPTAAACNLYPIPANTPPSAMVNGVKNGSETVAPGTVTLDGTGSTDNVYISAYVWTQVSGPNKPVISIPSGKKVNIIGLTNGTYVFQLRVTDNGWLADSTKYTLTVGNGGPTPVDNAGSNQTITLPTSSVTLTGTASESGGSIASTKWSEVSGPNTASFGNAAALSTTATGLIQGVYTLQLTATDASGVSVQSTVQITVKAAPGLPVVSAGSNQTITLPTSSVTLGGSGSETNGTIVSFTWTQVSGPSTATITSAATATTVVNGLVQGTYRFQLQIKDALGITASATVQVTVNAAAGPPTVSAGANQTITLPTNSVTLTGTASETGGSISSYSWTQVSGPSISSIASKTTASTAVSNLVQGVYRFQLTATDAGAVSASATVQVTVNAAIVAGLPTVSAGSDQVITLPTNSVTLTSTASETNGTIVSYAWTQTSGPNNSNIGSKTTASTVVNGLVQGVYTFQITVTDNSGVTAADAVKITVNPATVIPGTPTANAGSDQVITLPTNSVTLAGSGSETGGGTIVSYAWIQTSGPNNSSITTKTSATTAVSGLVQGVYTFQITVTDNSGVTATDAVKVTVNAAAAVPGPPSANAGADQTITLPTNSVTLAGGGTETNGTIVSYAWTQTSGPNNSSITTKTSATTAVNGLVQGVYIFQLTVTDNSGVTATDVVTVTVKAAAGVPGPPSANAGADQTITLPASSVTLTGSGSETNGTIVGYAWTQTSGPGNASILSNTSATTTVDNLVQGVYTFQLTVTDNSGVTATDVVKVTVNAAGAAAPPVAIAGPNQTITAPVGSAGLDGSGSYDTNGSIVSYNWVQISGLGGVTIANSNTATPTLYGLQVGTYVFQLTVTDNSGATSTSEVTITVISPNAKAGLVAIAGADTSIAYPASTAILNGSGSYETNGTIASYAWQQVSGPTMATISTDNNAMSTVSQLEIGTYVFQLTVTDATGNADTSTVSVTVVNAQRLAKTAFAIYPNPVVGSSITVTAVNSYTGQVGVGLHDMQGRLVQNYEFQKTGDEFEQTITLPANLARGVYFLAMRFQGEWKPTFYQIVKQ